MIKYIISAPEKMLNEIGLDYRKYSRRLSVTYIPFGVYIKLMDELIKGYYIWANNKRYKLPFHPDMLLVSEYSKELNQLRKEYLTKFYQEHPTLYIKSTGV